VENSNEFKSFGSLEPALAAAAQEAQKLSEIAYLEATKPKELQNQVVISLAYKRAKRLTNRLINAGYWEKSVISMG
jgi:hypothetical protein